MRSDTLAHDTRRMGHASAAEYDAYARAEHMLRCYGAGYACQHPEVLFGRSPTVDSDHQVAPVHRDAPYDPTSFHTRLGQHDATDDDLLVRIISAYQILDEIYAPCRTSVRAKKPLHETDMSTSTSIGDQR